MATVSGAVNLDVSRNNHLDCVESETINIPSLKIKRYFGCFDWVPFLKRKKVCDSSETYTSPIQEENLEDCSSNFHICAFGLKTLREPEPEENTEECTLQLTPEYIQKIKKYIKKQENWNRRLRKQRLKLTGEPVDRDEVKSPSKQDVQSIICYKRSLRRDNKALTKQIRKLKNACISTANVDTGAKVEGHFHACVSTPTTDTAAKQEDKPGDCILELTPEYIQKIKKYIKKQENWNRRLRKQLMKLTGEPVDRDEVKSPSKQDVQSIICYKRSLERDNKALTKQIKKLKNACISTPSIKKTS